MKSIYWTYFLITSLVVIHPLFANDSREGYVYGNISDQNTGEPIPFAALYIHESHSGTVSDINGRFTFSLEQARSYRVTVSSLGYQSLDTLFTLDNSTQLDIKLQPQSFALQEVVVSAKENVRGNSSSLIGKEALQHAQASSLADVLQLLPGGLTKEISMTSASYMQLRQAGSDVNTSLGTAFVMDGMTLSSDAEQNIYGMTSSPTVSRGIDLRIIAPDRIESVEVIRGIPSVEYGNLTAGVVKVELKRGKTPLEGRLKSDFNNKLFAVGKGFLLPREAGTLNIDLDYMNYTGDPRNRLDTYKRFTASGRYQNRFEFANNASFRVNTDLSYTGSFDKSKSDPDAMQGKEDYFFSDYNNASVTTSGTFTLPRRFVKELYYSASASSTRTLVERQHLITPGVMPLSSSMVEGAFDSEYLPAQYTSYLTVDGRPFTVRAKMQAKAEASTAGVAHNLLAGAEWELNKNRGKGELYDLNRPPYPATKSTRPRAYTEIPAINTLGMYAEDRLRLQTGETVFSAMIGLRASPALLPAAYDISGKWYWEPRVNLKVDLPSFQINGQTVHTALTAGAGKHYKFPTQAQLYPAPLYFDYVQLNYYSQNPALRALNVRTWIEDPTNYSIQPSLNVKQEVGLQVRAGQVRLDVTLFNERMNNGFSSESMFVSHTYQKYDPTSVDPSTITEKPGLSDFTFVDDTLSSLYSKARNNALVHKRGVEYTLALGKINALHTSVRIDGAWFHTRYSLHAPRYYKPGVVINNRTYPYVGIYDYSNTDNREMTQFNTNLYLDTHIPVLRMVFTTSVQGTWFTETTNPWNNGLPTGYLDDAGRYAPFLPEQADDPVMKHLVDTYTPYYFQSDRVAPAFHLFLKLRKEIGDFMEIGFYVNRVLSYLPTYTSKHNTIVNRSSDPFFGAEINVSF